MKKSSSSSTQALICYGEILWDCLPDGKKPGGAPMNVGYHLAQNHIFPVVVSAVGDDELGHALIEHLQKHGIDTRFIARHSHLSTGRVDVQLTPKGDAKYTILENVAWDQIEVSDELKLLAQKTKGIIFGTLAQRSANNLENLLSLLDILKHKQSALRIFDVNLRPPFDNHQLVWKLAQHANVIKLNDQEASILTGEQGNNLDIKLIRMARALFDQTKCPTICITAGEEGAGLFYQGQWFRENGKKIIVKDTIGSGDAFLAKLVQHLLLPAAVFNPKECLKQACRLGEWVATQAGAMPTYISSTTQSNSEPQILAH